MGLAAISLSHLANQKVAVAVIEVIGAPPVDGVESLFRALHLVPLHCAAPRRQTPLLLHPAKRSLNAETTITLPEIAPCRDGWKVRPAATAYQQILGVAQPVARLA
jgi:hypothetical protein